MSIYITCKNAANNLFNALNSGNFDLGTRETIINQSVIPYLEIVTQLEANIQQGINLAVTSEELEGYGAQIIRDVPILKKDLENMVVSR